MSVRNVSIAFIIFMIASFVAMISLFVGLKNSKEVIKECDENLERQIAEVESKNDDLAQTIELLEVNRERLQAYKDTLAILRPAIIEEEENQVGLNIGINYISTATLDKVSDYLIANKHEIYYSKKDPDVKNSFVIYYVDNLKGAAENIASGLSSKTGLTFKALKGRTPSSITRAAIEKTILIHAKG